MTEPDLSAGWRPIGELLAGRPADPQHEPAADKTIQRIQTRAAEKRTNRHDAIQTWAEKRQALREDRKAAREQRRQERDEQRSDRTAAIRRAKDAAALLAQRLLVTGPIVAPMAVAWTGQSQFAVRILGWNFLASLLYAAAYELTTAYWAWLYHQARTDGDSGWEYRLCTWLFAIGAAVQQWWHYSNHWHATPRSVTYSLMSAVGVLLWEGYARLIHRRKLRAEGKLPPARPRIGLARWVRYPVRSWTAWSLITLEGHRTLDAAWTAADAHLRSKKADRAAARTARQAARTARLDRVDRPGKRTAAASEPDRTALNRTGRTAIEAPTGPAHRTATARSGPDQQSQNSAGGPDRVDRSSPDQRPATTADSGPDPDRRQPQPSDERTDVDLELNDTERSAIEILQSTDRSISKRNIADVVRNELGRSIGSDRAAIIARHFRTLRPAA